MISIPVTIRSWEDMKAKLGLDEDGDINSEPVFSKYMKPLCETTIEVTTKDLDLYLTAVDSGYYISLDMIEPSDRLRVQMAFS